jgi:hypothetical protein
MDYSNSFFERTYPTPVIRGTRISRMDEKRLGDLNFDDQTSAWLSQENVAVFAGGCDDLDLLVTKLRQLDNCGTGGHWVVVLSTKKMAAAFYQRWLNDSDIYFVKPTDVPPVWKSERIYFTVPEHLEDLADVLIESECDVAGVIVLDLFCIIHQPILDARQRRVVCERSEFVVEFRSRLRSEHGAPPLLFLSQKPAKSVNTQTFLGPYCLDAMQFVNGATIRMGTPPQEWYVLHKSAETQFVS